MLLCAAMRSYYDKLNVRKNAAKRPAFVRYHCGLKIIPKNKTYQEAIKRYSKKTPIKF